MLFGYMITRALLVLVRAFGRRRMGATFDRVVASLGHRLAAETASALARGMHYPVRREPFFKDFMTPADIDRYPTQHFDFHPRRLTLETGAD